MLSSRKRCWHSCNTVCTAEVAPVHVCTLRGCEQRSQTTWAITKKSLDKAPKRLPGMLLRALAYDVDVKYMEWKKMFLASTLCRAFLPAKKVQIQAEFETINAITFIPMREKSITNIRHETDRDESLQPLKRAIQLSWPQDKASVPSLAAPYYHFRYELAVIDGLIFRGERLVIPGTMMSEIKKNIAAHARNIITRNPRTHSCPMIC